MAFRLRPILTGQKITLGVYSIVEVWLMLSLLERAEYKKKRNDRMDFADNNKPLST